MTTLRTRAAVLATSATLAAAGLVGAAANAGATAPACRNAALAISHTPSQGATGHGSFVVLFKNITHSTCSLYGYPGLDALNASGQVLAHAQRTLHGFAGGAHTETTVNVTPGHYASASVEWMNFNPVTTGPCTFSKSVAATPANTTHTVHLAVSVSVCRLQVHPTVAGFTGNN
jgi:Protein of unknown function (DUF4232)